MNVQDYLSILVKSIFIENLALAFFRRRSPPPSVWAWP